MNRCQIAIAVFFCSSCGENQSPWTEKQQQSIECWSDLDGEISSAEFILRGDTTIEYGVDEDISLSSSWYDESVWNVQSEWQDSSYTMVPRPLHDQWFAQYFPEGEWVLPTDQTQQIVGIYSQNESGLWLWGSASFHEEPSEGTTLIHYEQPIPALRFPLHSGLTWEATAEITGGIIQGLPFYGSHEYSYEITEQKELLLGGFVFQNVMQVHSQFTVETDVGTGFSVRQNSFFAPCTGELLRFESDINETQQHFTSIRRIQSLMTD